MIKNFRFEKKAKGVQNRSRFTRSSGASHAVAVRLVKTKQTKLNNVLRMHSFDHKLLLRKVCGPLLTTSQMPHNADTRTQWLAALQSFHPPK